MRGQANEMKPVMASPGVPRHVAIIMDGNGRWARARGLPRAEGHRRGVEALRRAVRFAATRGIDYLTLFSFSSENWSRPASEVGELLDLLRLFIRRDVADLKRDNVRIRVIGNRETLPPDIIALLQHAERETALCTGLHLVVAFNYGSRDEITRAVRRIAERVERGELRASDIDAAMVEQGLDTAGIPDPDLILRTSGEQRVSNFLLWQAAYSEFVFLPGLWPDFDDPQFEAALEQYSCRERRYGGVVSA